jgi:hypothetical protein
MKSLGGPLSKYQNLIKKQYLKPNIQQQKAAALLQNLSDSLSSYDPKPLSQPIQSCRNKDLIDSPDFKFMVREQQSFLSKVKSIKIRC